MPNTTNITVGSMLIAVSISLSFDIKIYFLSISSIIISYFNFSYSLTAMALACFMPCVIWFHSQSVYGHIVFAPCTPRAYLDRPRDVCVPYLLTPLKNASDAFFTLSWKVFTFSWIFSGFMFSAICF